jgi:hypothetical protein
VRASRRWMFSLLLIIFYQSTPRHKPKDSNLQFTISRSVSYGVSNAGYYYFIVISGVRLSPLGTATTTGLLYQPRTTDECGAIGRMKIDRENRSTRRKRAPAPLGPPQIPHDLTRARTRTAAVGSRRLTALAMARPCGILLIVYERQPARSKALIGRNWSFPFQIPCELSSALSFSLPFPVFICGYLSASACLSAHFWRRPIPDRQNRWRSLTETELTRV